MQSSECEWMQANHHARKQVKKRERKSVSPELYLQQALKGLPLVISYEIFHPAIAHARFFHFTASLTFCCKHTELLYLIYLCARAWRACLYFAYKYDCYEPQLNYNLTVNRSCSFSVILARDNQIHVHSILYFSVYTRSIHFNVWQVYAFLWI